MKLELELDEVGINMLYGLIENNLEQQLVFLQKLIAAGKISAEECLAAEKQASERCREMQRQIREQYPVVTASFDQVKASVEDMLRRFYG